MAAPSFPERRIRAAMSAHAYATDTVRLADTDVRGFDCLVASRQGVFAVARDERVRRVAHGFFFGVRRHRDAIYLFEACDRPSEPSNRGRIVRLTLADGQLESPVVLVKGLDNQCHQVGVVDDALCVVDTRNQCVPRFTLDGAPIDVRHPIAPGTAGVGDACYRHMNGIAVIDGQVAVMLHNGLTGANRRSELVRLDPQWREVARETLDGHGCHDIVVDADGTVWHCGSLEGTLINSTGLKVKVSDRMTRGLAIAPDAIIVGASSYGDRSVRDELDGEVVFLDRRLGVEARVVVPGAPTDLILL
ncbi:hypothetical protein M9980_09995 [Sphingomonas donggukensis]|uniref:SMP-30/Gluconolactonase/LRE-like region domain-containing protein n=1 Tax=Sphingomonas donggukensis TaxID=2949093 RepID=A0ABY4TR81_9SPHN|nr:hypothetical protein [Sphingomonas donggukensis]URW74895.1 hypothetical protein M9980_09995 [Sphingomonas donggukensis]